MAGKLPVWLLPPLFACALACGDKSTEDGASEETGECTPGTETCACAPDGVCDSGLICVSNQCIADDGTSTGPGDGDGDTGDGDGDTGDGDGDQSCHPLMIDCPVGETCTWDGQMFLCSTAIIKFGDSCVPDEPVCISGFCAPQAMLPDCPSTHCCTPFCNLDSPNCPMAGTECVDFFPDGATTPEVGACLVP
jgi:hypothetical protein